MSLPAHRVAEEDNAYTQYAAAAAKVDACLGSKAQKVLLRTSYSVTQRQELSTLLKPAIDRLTKARGEICQIPEASTTKAPIPYRSEWRLLGRVLRWREEDACEKGAFGEAIYAAALASKLGFDLSGGSAADATLGFTIVNESRRTIAPYLVKMDSGQLALIAESVKAAYLGRPSISDCLERSAADMMGIVQHLQDSYRTEDYTWVSEQLGPSSKDGVELLQNLHQQPDSVRAKFFAGMAEEARQRGTILLENGKRPASARIAFAPTEGVSRPWRKLARRFFAMGDPILSLNDATTARTELLILEAEIRRTLKATGQTPTDLSRFTKSLTVDPYSGDQLVYRTDGRDFKIYSVGSDLTDNNGETDETYTRPDLTLEHPPQ